MTNTKHILWAVFYGALATASIVVYLVGHDTSCIMESKGGVNLATYVLISAIHLFTVTFYHFASVMKNRFDVVFMGDLIRRVIPGASALFQFIWWIWGMFLLGSSCLFSTLIGGAFFVTWLVIMFTFFSSTKRAREESNDIASVMEGGGHSW
ncbi:MAG: hypothetical protein CMK92_02355 [Pseudomonas sp.]|nr:hypothetical protein [Pseudomonas sp.]